MDKRLILAVAGSGKTSLIVDRLTRHSRALVLTYTKNNLRNLRYRVLEKFGFVPKGVSIQSYFSFLYSFCFKPFLWRECRVAGLRWDPPPPYTIRLPRNNPKFYFDVKRRVYHNRLAKLLETKGVLESVNERLERYFDSLFIDEVQDFGGHDFNLLPSIAGARMNQMFVGDFYQHTFDTSRDGNLNSGLYRDKGDYLARFPKMGLTVDESTLSHSYRCSPTVCTFVTENLGINIQSHRDDVTPIRFLEQKHEVKQILKSSEIIKLFYQEHYRYPVWSQNWGAVKGDTYSQVCVVLNKNSYTMLMDGNAESLAPGTRNKLYVACTRTRGALYFVSEDLVRECLQDV